MDIRADLHQAAIDRSSKNPLYHQLFIILRDRILFGEWQPGTLIPSEPELMRTYQVSRITLRQAMNMLVDENLITRQRGKGTFVTHPSISGDALHVMSFDDDMRRRGLKPETKVLETLTAEVSRATAEKLKIEVGEELAIIRRLRLADGLPMCKEDSFLVHRFCPGILEGRDYSVTSLRQTLVDDYNIRLLRATQTLSAIFASETLAKHLGITTSIPVLYIERISFSQLDIPYEMRHIYYRADRYSLHHELQG